MDNKPKIGNELLNNQAIVLFDGVCNLCNSSVDFIISREKRDTLKFASLQSDLGKAILASYTKSEVPDSILFLQNGILYSKSTAALRVATHLVFPWYLLRFLEIIPSALRDKVYDFIAANRYTWFGKKESCRMPTPEERAKFLG